MRRVFLWVGIDRDGNLQNGTLEAENYQYCETELSLKNILPLKITKQFKWNLKIFFNNFKYRKYTTKSLVNFVQQFAGLIKAYVPLVKSFEIMQKENVAWRSLLCAIKNEIENGKSLSDAFSKWPAIFNKLFCNMIKVGEESGTLDYILDHLLRYLTKKDLQRRKIIKIMLYPCLVLFVTLLVVCILLVFVVPEFKIMFANFGVDLPAYTRGILAIADLVKAYGIMMLVFMSALIFLYMWCRKIDKFRLVSDKFLLRLPWVGSVIKKNIILRLVQVLAVTLKSGLPLLRSLKLVQDVVTNQVFNLAIKDVYLDVSNGLSLHQAMYKTEMFAPFVIQLVAIGEESGSIDEMFAKIAERYENELNQIADNINCLLEPIIMLLLGTIVGGIIVGMYLPIFKLGMVI